MQAMPIERDGETYLTASEVTKLLGISRDTFYRSVRNRLQVYQVGILKRTYYRKSDVERLQEIHPRDNEE
jgi:excisionase family DNA binding protein